MINCKFVFIILHYITIEDTERCVKSIKENCEGQNIEIIIVDNGSPNDSGKYLYEQYKNDMFIKVIINKENLGFAKGNNVGFVYAKKINPDFIILCNNDTYLTDNDFCSKIITEYKKSNFSVLGPKIILKNGKINHISTNLPSIKKTQKFIKKTYRKYFMYRYMRVFVPIYDLYCYFKAFIKKMLKRILVHLKIIRNKSLENDDLKRRENIILHGCFLIFSRNYIDKFDGLNDKTFLYREEELLFIRLMMNNLLSVYNPDIFIHHNEDGATNAINKSNIGKQLFLCKNQIDSSKVLLEELKLYRESQN